MERIGKGEILGEKRGGGGERVAVAVVGGREEEAEVCSLGHVLIGMIFEGFKGKQKKGLQNSKPFFYFPNLLSFSIWIAFQTYFLFFFHFLFYLFSIVFSTLCFHFHLLGNGPFFLSIPN